MTTNNPTSLQDTPSANILTNLQALSGNSVQIFFAMKPVGYLQNFSAQNDYGMQPLSGIGDAHAQEYVPGMATHTLTADRAVVRKQSLFNILGGGPQGDGWNSFANMDGALEGKVFDIAVIQKRNSVNSASQGHIVRWWKNCTLAADSFTIGKHAIVYSNVTIHALDVQGDMHGDWQSGQQVTDMDAESGKPQT